MEKAYFGFSASRIISFSDSVFAFAITLLVLKIDLPNLSDDLVATQLTTELLKLWPQVLVNILSFLVIGNYWIIHHKLFNHIKQYDSVLVWLNIFLLMSVSFLPFPTDLLGSYSNQQISVVLYAGALAFVGIMQFLVWYYASHNHRLVDKNLSEAYIRFYSVRNLIPPVVFLFSIVLSFIDLDLAKFSWALILVIMFLIRRKHIPAFK